MSAEDLPVELLEMIFSKLTAKEAVACRAVCRRWRDVVDSLSDKVWERYCCRDFWNPQAANKVSNLGFRELYKSLALWSRVEEAEVTCKQVSKKLVHCFIILNNNILVVLMYGLRNRGSELTKKLYCNEVEYYNIDTMKLISREHYNCYIEKYDENEKLIALVDVGGTLCVVTKSNKKRFIVGCQSYMKKIYTLFDTQVYFVDAKQTICVAQLKVVDGEETIVTEELEEIEENVIAFAHATENSVNMLTDEGNIYCYRHCNKVFEACTQIDSWSEDIIYELSEYGFHWSDPEIYAWIQLFNPDQVDITLLKIPVILFHNHLVLIGTSQGMVQIFKKPYRKNGELKVNNARPSRSVDMNKYSDIDKADVTSWIRKSKHIKQLGVVEILNGHRIIALTKNKLFFVDLVHKQQKVNKRNAKSLIHIEPSTSSNKKAKTIKINITKGNGTPLMEAEKKENALKKKKKCRKTNVTVHVYNTRSKDK